MGRDITQHETPGSIFQNCRNKGLFQTVDYCCTCSTRPCRAKADKDNIEKYGCGNVPGKHVPQNQDITYFIDFCSKFQYHSVDCFTHNHNHLLSLEQAFIFPPHEVRYVKLPSTSEIKELCYRSLTERNLRIKFVLRYIS